MYTVTIPCDPSFDKQVFGSLRKAKKYARTLPAQSTSIDSMPMVYDNDYPTRLIRLQEDGKFNYLFAPDSWKN